jgi:hypothetical protein
MLRMDKERAIERLFGNESEDLTSHYFRPRGGGLSSIWHVRTTDGPGLSAEMAALDSRLLELDEAIRHATNRQRYANSPEEAARAGDDLTRLVADLDRLMTRKRAVEAKLLLVRKMSEETARQDSTLGRPGEDPSEWPDRLTVEVYRRLDDRGMG